MILLASDLVVLSSKHTSDVDVEILLEQLVCAINTTMCHPQICQ